MRRLLPFTAMENVVLESRELSLSDKMFYLALKSFRNDTTGECFPAMKTIAKKAGMAKNTATKAKNRLVALNVITYTPGNGRKHNSMYGFPLVDGTAAQRKLVELRLAGKKLDNDRSKERHQRYPNQGHEGTQKKDTNKKNRKRRIVTRESSSQSIFKKESPTLSEIGYDKQVPKVEEVASSSTFIGFDDPQLINKEYSPGSKQPTPKGTLPTWRLRRRKLTDQTEHLDSAELQKRKEKAKQQLKEFDARQTTIVTSGSQVSHNKNDDPDVLGFSVASALQEKVNENKEN